MSNRVVNGARQWRVLVVLVFLVLLSVGCQPSATQPPSPSASQPTTAAPTSPPTPTASPTPNATSAQPAPSTPHATPAPTGPSEGPHLLITANAGPDHVIERLGQPQTRGRWAAGETFLYFDKGMQVNFKDGKVLSLSLYDEGVVLRPGAPPFKKYQGVVEGISFGKTVEQVAKAWGQPTNAYARGDTHSQTIVLHYENHSASLTVWPAKERAPRKNSQSSLPRSADINAQHIQSITLYWTNSKKE